MGLDVYLYTKAEAENDRLHYEEEEAFYGKEYDIEHTEEEIEEFRKNRKYSWQGSSDVSSKKYGGQTLCNRRYLRSSYNGGGFDSAVPQMTGNENYTFDWIFGEVKEHQDYRVPLDKDAVPALMIARERAAEVAQALRDMDAPVKVATVSPNPFLAQPNRTATDAIAWYREQLEKVSGMPEMFQHGWSSGDGEFFGKNGLEVVAAVPGAGLLGNPAVHLVFRVNLDTVVSYIETADIVGEFIDEALELIDTDGFCEMRWSG